MPSVDDDSVDMTLHQTGGKGTIRSPKLDLQLKTTALTTPDEQTFGFSIKRKNYDDLREVAVLVPRILIVVLVPESLDHWMMQTEEQLAMRHCGYWLSLHGLPASENDAGQTVNMNRAQSFTVSSLQAIMNRIGQGQLP